MASFVRNIPTKNYQNLIIGFQVTVENVVDVFLKHSVIPKMHDNWTIIPHSLLNKLLVS